MSVPIDSQTNVLIAEACGWKWYRLPHTPSDGERRYRCLFLPSVLEIDGKLPERFEAADMTERICNWKYMQREGLVPDYVADLNAMHEAEASLPNLPEYEQSLKWICDHDWQHAAVPMKRNPIYATARQRAEAFLRAIGRWPKEDRDP